MLKRFNDFHINESLTNINTDEVKSNIEDILIELNDIGINCNVAYDEKEGIQFYEILLYSNSEFKKDDSIRDCIWRISKYLSIEYKNPLLDISLIRVNNMSYYETNSDKSVIDYTSRLNIYYFGFIVNNPLVGQYVKVPPFWHHYYAKKMSNHTY